MSYNLTFLENSSASGVITGIQNNVPSFLPLLLAFEFIIIMVAGSGTNARKTGYTNLLQWGALAGLVTTTSAFLLGGVFISQEDYVSFLPTIIICITITVIFALGVFLSKDD